MIDFSKYVLGNNEPLNHARFLWSKLPGTVTATGTNGSYADNDYTNQRWKCGALPATWTLVSDSGRDFDTLFIAAHNLGSTGASVEVQTAAVSGGPYVSRLTVTPSDDDVIALMLNDDGLPYVVREIRIIVSGSSSLSEVGIIRAGKALQMARPVYSNTVPLGLARTVTTRHTISETGQWLGRITQRQTRNVEMQWQHFTADWYRANFAPFALSLPQSPFGLIQNPLRMPDGAGWCWTDTTPIPSYMGIRDLMQVNLPIVGFLNA